MSRLDEKLIQYAYNELSEPEAKKIAALLDSSPKLQARYRVLSKTRCNLNLLKDIPEHQMSTERLRDAILGQGLKPRSAPEPAARPITNIVGWAMAALAVGAFAFVGSARLRSAPTHTAGPSLATKESGHHLPLNPIAVKQNRPAAMNTLANSEKMGGAKLINAEAGSRRSNGHQRASIEPTMTHVELPDQIVQNLAQDSFGVTPLGRNSKHGLGDLSATKHPAQIAAARKGRTLVYIDGDEDAATGLPKAKEVADASHVVLSS